MKSVELKQMFDYFYNAYFNDLYAYGKTLGVAHEDLQDVIHDVFLHIIDHFEILKFYDSNIKFYLLKCLKNKIISNLRQQKDFCTMENVNEYDLSFRVTGLDVLIDREEQTLLVKWIDSMLQHLTERQREAIDLRYMKELSYEEIAGILHITEKGSRKLVSRAILELKSLQRCSARI